MLSQTFFWCSSKKKQLSLLFNVASFLSKPTFSLPIFSTEMLAYVHQNNILCGDVGAEVHACHRERLKEAEVSRDEYPNAMEFYDLDPEKHEARLDN